MVNETVSVNRSSSDSEYENVATPVDGSNVRPEKRSPPTALRSMPTPPIVATLVLMKSAAKRPAEARAQFRAGLSVPTAGLAAGYTQANLIAVPADLADDLRRFAELNPKPCPLLDMSAPGDVTTK